MTEALKKISSPTLPRSELAQEIATRAGHQEKTFSEQEIQEAHDRGVFIFRSVDEFAEIAEKDISEWPPLLRKNGTKIKMDIPPGLNQGAFEIILEKFQKKRTEYLLQNGVMITPEQSAKAHEKVAENKVKEFLKTNPQFELEIENKIGDTILEPTENYKKGIYERLIFGQKCLIKIQLFDFLKSESQKSETELKQATQDFINKRLEELLQLDKNGDGKLIYNEIIPKDSEERKFAKQIFDNAPFFLEMRESEIFNLNNPDVEKNTEAKKDFIKNHLVSFAEKLIDPKTGEATKGSGLRLVEMMKTIMLQTVGDRQLTNAEFNKMWSELKNDESVSSVYNEVDKNGESKKTELENWLGKEDVDIRKIRLEADKAMQKIRAMDRANPHGFTFRKLGSLGSVLLYFGKDILIGTIGLGAALSGFNPLKMIQNPVMMGSIAAIFGITKYYNPEFMAGASPTQKIEQSELKTKFETAPQPIKNWLAKFSQKDLDQNGVIGKLLLEEKRNEITSTELETILKKRNEPIPDDSELKENSTAAKTIFQLFKACKQRDMDPSNLGNE